MTNEYLDPSVDRVVDGVTARAADVNALRDSTAAGFDLLPTSAQMKRGTIGYAVDTGLVNAYVVALPYVPSGYVDGLHVAFRPLLTNTGASTINVNGLGVKSIRLTDSSPTSAGELYSGVPVDIRYSTATGFFHLAPNSIVDAVAAEAAAVAAALSETNAATSEANAAASEADAAASEAAVAAMLLSGIPEFVPGDTYVYGNAVFSPINLQTYRHSTATSSLVTDPSLDPINWAGLYTIGAAPLGQVYFMANH